MLKSIMPAFMEEKKYKPQRQEFEQSKGLLILAYYMVRCFVIGLPIVWCDATYFLKEPYLTRLALYLKIIFHSNISNNVSFIFLVMNCHK